MAVTPYSPTNQAFSDKGHHCAQTVIYPLIFPNSELEFTPLPEEQAMTLDADMGMDRRVLVKVHTLRESFQVMVQERFRNTRWADKQDITVTEWNNNSNLPGELYKIKSEMFLYAYYDEVANRFVEAIAFSVLNLKIALAQGVIPYTIPSPNGRSNQTFLCFKFDDLEQQHIAVFRKRWERQVNTAPSLADGIQRAKQRSYATTRIEKLKQNKPLLAIFHAVHHYQNHSLKCPICKHRALMVNDMEKDTYVVSGTLCDEGKRLIDILAKCTEVTYEQEQS